MGNKKKDFHSRLIEHVYDNMPAFTDVFTEDTFYIFAITLVISTLVVVFIISRFVTIKEVDL